VPFGTELVHYAVGIASCAVPGVPAGLHELWSRHGRLPWGRLVEPALALARDGVEMPPAHAACLAMLSPVMTMREGARIYSPGGNLLEAGDRLEQKGLGRALELVRDEGARSFYEGSLAEALLDLMIDRGGLVTRRDLDGYGPRWLDPLESEYVGNRVLTRGGLTASLGKMLAQLPRLRGASPAERALTLARVLVALPYSGEGEPLGDTTNLVTADADGNACVLTTSLGLGSGDYLPGLDVHLNSMLGEADLLVHPLEPGERMESMMAPTVVLSGEGPVLAAGAAGGTRLRPALVQVLASILDEGLDPQDAVNRPRLHSTGTLVHLEPGFDESAIGALDREYEVRAWNALHHYFGGVSLIAESGGAADPRRSGAALGLP
jgi:gamma-glutamyltranspeptidase/glutathione hydrolase